MPDTTKESLFIDGSFSCYLCHKTFNYEIKLLDNALNLHFQAHVGRFMKQLFSDAQILGAFYEYCHREYNMSLFIELNKKVGD